MLLNLKKLAIQVPSDEPRVLRMEVSGPRDVKGEDVPETGVEILNPEVHLFTLDAGARVVMELGVGVGPPLSGGRRAGRHHAGRRDLGRRRATRRSPAWPTTSRCRGWARSPTTRSWSWRSGPTARSVPTTPSPGPPRSCAITSRRCAPPGPDEDEEAETGAGDAYLRDALGKTLEELALPARAINALKGAELNLVADLVQKTELDLADVKNLGEKSIDEIKTALAALGLSLGMRIDPNVLGALGRGGDRRTR